MMSFDKLFLEGAWGEGGAEVENFKDIWMIHVKYEVSLIYDSRSGLTQEFSAEATITSSPSVLLMLRMVEMLQRGYTFQCMLLIGLIW